MIDAFGGKAFEHGSAYCVDDFSGAVHWLPPGIGPDSEVGSSPVATPMLRRSR